MYKLRGARRHRPERALRETGDALTKAGGLALKQAIHVGRAKAGITSDMQLAVRAHVSYDTLMNWYADRTVPRGKELQKVARALGINYSELEAAYEGRDPEPPPLQDAIRELAVEISALVGRIDRLLVEQATASVEMMRALGVIGGQAPPGTPDANGPAVRVRTGR